MSDFTATWGWPQWTIVVLILLDLCVRAAKHGQPRDAYNAFLAFIDTGILLFVLIAGGFFA